MSAPPTNAPLTTSQMNPPQQRAQTPPKTTPGQSLFVSEMLVGQSVKHSLLGTPLHRTNAEYQTKLKSEFLTSKFIAEGKLKEEFTGKSGEEYAKQMMSTNEAKLQSQLSATPSLADSKITPGAHFTGSSRQMKKGFCGSSVVNHNLDLYVNEKGDLIMKPPQTNTDPKKAKEPGRFTGSFRDMKVVDLKGVLDYQNTQQGKKEIGKNLEQLVVPPPGNYKWLLAFGKPGEKDGESERCYFFFKDDEDLEKFRNTVMGTSNFGKSFLHDTDPRGGGAGAIEAFIMRRKVAYSEKLMDSIQKVIAKREEELHDIKRREEDRLRKIKEEEEMERAKKAAIKHIEPVHSPPVQTPVRRGTMSDKQRREYLRRIAVKSLLKRELNEHLHDKELKRKYCLKIMRNLGDKHIQSNKRMTLARWVLWMQAQRQFEAQNSMTELIVTPRKYYNLYPDNESRSDLRTQHLSELHIVVSSRKLAETEIAGSDFQEDHKMHVDLLPVPTGGMVQTTEYNVISAQCSFDVTKFVGLYLIAYIKNKEAREVVCIGDYKITPKMENAIIIEMFNSNQRYAENQARFPVGAVVFKREGANIKLPEDPAFEALTHPKYYGYMKKFYSTLIKDLGLGAISEPEGAGKKYQKIRNYIGEEYLFGNAVSRYETERYRREEWAFFEKSVQECNTAYIRRIQQTGASGSAIISSSNDLANNMRGITVGPLYNRAVDSNPKNFLFLSRDHWRDAQEFVTPKIREIHDKALMTGAPEYLYIPVWKSVGKVNIVAQIIYDLCRAKIPQFNETASIVDQLAAAGKDELYHNPNVDKDLAQMDKEYVFEPGHYKVIRKVLCAFLKLSMIMEDVSDEPDRTEPLLKGFSLKSVGGLVHIVRHLVYLRFQTEKNKHRDDRCKNISDDDVFWVLMAMAFIILPEHFLNPLFRFNPTDSSKSFYKEMLRFGVNFEKLQRNKMFVSSSAIGSYKLSLILAQCIRKEARDVYEKMTDLGFPFLSFCLDLSESMFSEHFNADTLSRVWNVAFFEGADIYKRRAQQIILSALMVTIKNCRRQILASRSSEEVLWHLRAQSQFVFDGTQFISDVFKTRKAYFVYEGSGPGLINKISSMFSQTGPSVEADFQEIKGEISEDFDTVSRGNRHFMQFLVNTTQSIESQGKFVDSSHLRGFLNAMVVGLNPEQNKIKLNFEDKFTRQAYVLGEKPQPQTVNFYISSWDFGNYLPENLKVTVQSNFKRDSYSMRSFDANWYRMQTFDATMVQNVSQSWIDVKIDGVDRMGKAFSHTKRFTLDRFRFNKNSFFTFKFNSFWMVLCFKMNSSEVKTDEIDYFKNLDHDVQHRNTIFCEEFADHMEIAKESPYKEELLNNTCEKIHLEFITAYAYRLEEVKFSEDVNKFVVRSDLLGKNSPNLFETIVRIILFSPIDNMGVIRQFFTLLSRLDLSPDPHRVKRTHVEFLIWYILRTTQIYLPYIEIVSTVSQIIHDNDSHIISAVVTSLQDSRKPSLDITELMNLWFIAQRRRTGNSDIILGTQGKINNLAKAISYWQTEHKQPAYKFSKLNKLRVFLNCKGETRKIDIKFNDEMNIIMDNKDRDFRVDGNFVLLLEDTEESLNFAQFTKVMSRFPILDWIFSRLTGIGGDSKTAKVARELKTEELKDPNVNNEVIIKFRFHQDASNDDLAVVHMKKMTELRLLDYKRDTARLDYILDNQTKFSFSKNIPDIKNFAVLEGEMTVRTMIDEALAEVQNEIISAVDMNNYTYKYKFHCLDLLSANFDHMAIFVEGRQLNPEYYDVSVKDLLERLNSPARMHLLVEIRKQDLRPLYNHMARDIYYLEGIDVVDNPFVSCQILSQNTRFAEVLFKNDIEKRMVALDDIVTSDQ